MATDQSERNWAQAIFDGKYETAEDETQSANEARYQLGREAAYRSVYVDPKSPLYQSDATAQEATTVAVRAEGTLSKGVRRFLEIATKHTEQLPAGPVSRAILEGESRIK